jgi:hypothetical protein
MPNRKMYFDVKNAIVDGLSAEPSGKEWLTDFSGSATEIQHPRKASLKLAEAAFALG